MSNNAASHADSELPNSELARAGSAEAANVRLQESAEWIDVLLNNHEQLHRMHTARDFAVLITSHALQSLLDFELGRIASALEEIAESVDFIAARPECDDEKPQLTEREKEIIYQALEYECIERGELKSIEEMDAALARFKKIAGL